jgi:hypothetical protein
MRFLSLIAAIGLAAAALTYAAAAGTRQKNTPHPTAPPIPLPAGLDAVPGVQAEIESLAPGQSVLLAVKPAGSTAWLKPSDTDATIVGGETVKGTFEPNAAIAAANTGNTSHGARVGHRLARPATTEVNTFGCSYVDRFPPLFVAQGVIQGGENFSGCTNLATTEADVCIKESSTYSCHAGSTSFHGGNSDWTAASGTWICQYVQEGWNTYATNVYTATTGASHAWAGNSGWQSLYC